MTTASALFSLRRMADAEGEQAILRNAPRLPSCCGCQALASASGRLQGASSAQRPATSMANPSQPPLLALLLHSSLASRRRSSASSAMPAEAEPCRSLLRQLGRPRLLLLDACWASHLSRGLEAPEPVRRKPISLSVSPMFFAASATEPPEGLPIPQRHLFLHLASLAASGGAAGRQRSGTEWPMRHFEEKVRRFSVSFFFFCVAEVESQIFFAGRPVLELFGRRPVAGATRRRFPRLSTNGLAGLSWRDHKKGWNLDGSQSRQPSNAQMAELVSFKNFE
eukprot:scaffold2710_cov204-Pinguiococcus_pyrenoidosus.AAC.4